MPLSKNQIKFLRSLCHDLKPVVMLGQKGLTNEVLHELDIALNHHELVKIKLSVDDREERAKMIDEICARSEADRIQTIGKTISLYRPNLKKPVIALPAA
ncbi:MAG: ribosome assembly RNA-binding protein YhbY [Gammaproteobacteria bacterium]|jgi:RNA-binding protein